MQNQEGRKEQVFEEIVKAVRCVAQCRRTSSDLKTTTLWQKL